MQERLCSSTLSLESTTPSLFSSASPVCSRLHAHHQCLAQGTTLMDQTHSLPPTTPTTHRVSEAYGRMILGEGLFQADGHPGNILVRPGGRIGLLDYGQSKQLSDKDRKAIARLILALSKGKSGRMRGNEEEISRCMEDLGIQTQNADPQTRAEMGE
jgi:predicted unusual protein kinase regulating ubiquinone biosynthesis (AarF/ABC1/UbiB family)